MTVRADSFFKEVDARDADPKRNEHVVGEENAHPAASLFWFDPNTLSYSDWEKLGLSSRTIRTILHYLEKGGRFRRPDDLGRIWGLPPDQFSRLRPYVRIAGTATTERIMHAGDMAAQATQIVDTASPRVYTPSFKKRILTLDVNQADSLQWLALPGIGEKLTSRILRFRERLGGFCTVDQVGETWGLPDSTFQKLRPMLTLSATSTRKIPLNTAPEDLLQQHPYIRYKLAKVIIRYREEHGPFAAVSDLRRIALVTDDVYARLEPYCTVN